MLAVRPLDASDHHPLATLLYGASATDAAAPRERFGKAAVHFFARTGHAFVAEVDEAPLGVVLAQAVWDGARPTLQVQALTVSGHTEQRERTAAALLDAVTKSAYDAAVYDLRFDLPEEDELMATLLQRRSWRPAPLRVWIRTLGSRRAATGVT